MNEPFLIAHKVRGQPAFDIAIRIPCPECTDPEYGTEGCVECNHLCFWWIIPTSGHRAYPYWYTMIVDNVSTFFINDEGHNTVEWFYPKMPPDHPDHYQPTSAPRKAPSSLLKTLGLGQPDLANFKRRI